MGNIEKKVFIISIKNYNIVYKLLYFTKLLYNYTIPLEQCPEEQKGHGYRKANLNVDKKVHLHIEYEESSFYLLTAK